MVHRRRGIAQQVLIGLYDLAPRLFPAILLDRALTQLLASDVLPIRARLAVETDT